jgi:hypothetical protein
VRQAGRGLLVHPHCLNERLESQTVVNKRGCMSDQSTSNAASKQRSERSKRENKKQRKVKAFSPSVCLATAALQTKLARPRPPLFPLPCLMSLTSPRSKVTLAPVEQAPIKYGRRRSTEGETETETETETGRKECSNTALVCLQRYTYNSCVKHARVVCVFLCCERMNERTHNRKTRHTSLSSFSLSLSV